jgi:surface antigen
MFGSAGGSSCVNPADPTNQNDWYDWGIYDSNHVFHQYRNGYEYRNCTDYVQWKESTIGVPVPSTWGNGGQWYDHAPANKQSTTPKAWDAAVKPGAVGHVAFVESVNSDGTITVSEYNHDTHGGGDTRTGTASSMGFTEFVDFGVHPPNGGGGGSSANIPLMGDVTGNHKADAALVNPANGDVWVALSTGGSFAGPQLWSANSMIANATKYFLADVNGDGKVDLIAFFAPSGNWYVALSSGSGFWPPTQWAANEGGNSSNQFVADVNGDGKADVVLFWNSVSGQPQGTWAVDLSSGSGFYGPPNQWITGAGVGSTSQVVGDFNGDGLADVAMYYASTGVWNVSLSTGSSFGYPGSWSSGHGMGSNIQLAGDVSGDGKADVNYFWSSGSICGTWEVGTSSGSGFWSPTYWATNEGCGGTTQFIADVTGSGKGAVVTYWDNVSGQPPGMWTVDTSSGSGFYGPPNQWITGFGDNKT